MANTTFNGPVRSENGFIGATKNSTTGAFTNVFRIDASGNYVGTLMIGQGICLLYTSPSPRDRTRSRMPSSA